MAGEKNFRNSMKSGNNGDSIDKLIAKFVEEMNENGEEVTVQKLRDKILESCKSPQQMMEFQGNIASILLAIERSVGKNGVEKCITDYCEIIREYLGDFLFTEDTVRRMIMDDKYSIDPLGPLKWKLDLKYII